MSQNVTVVLQFPRYVEFVDGIIMLGGIFTKDQINLPLDKGQFKVSVAACFSGARGGGRE